MNIFRINDSISWVCIGQAKPLGQPGSMNIRGRWFLAMQTPGRRFMEYPDIMFSPFCIPPNTHPKQQRCLGQSVRGSTFGACSCSIYVFCRGGWDFGCQGPRPNTIEGLYEFGPNMIQGLHRLPESLQHPTAHVTGNSAASYTFGLSTLFVHCGSHPLRNPYQLRWPACPQSQAWQSGR